MTARDPSPRVVPLEGGRNFRDLGGYATADGRRVRWGRVYRSGVLAYLSDADRAHLAARGVRLVVDLRAPAERSREPSRWGEPAPESLHWDYDFSTVSLRSVLREVGEDLSAETLGRCVAELYRRLPALFAGPYAELLARLAAGGTPLVFHCSAGKDRTGIAAALILTALGVPRETILEDYVLTNRVVDLEAELFVHPRTSIGVGDQHAHLTRIAPEARAPLLQARPEYLAAALAQIERDHGSVDAYLRSALGVTDARLRAIRDHLLEA